MRLMNAKSGILHEIRDSELKKHRYAILSHRWEADEVTFRDLQIGKYRKKWGYRKIRHLRYQAKADGLDWVWIDTCCIDKDSSSELSEAINSMFRWYQGAEVCYIYLSDVSLDHESNKDSQAWENAFLKSMWFTRGWTLQELLAPSHRVFYDTDWFLLGAIETHHHEMHYAGAVCDDQARYRRGVWKSIWSSEARNTTTKSVDIIDAVQKAAGVGRDVLLGNMPLRDIRVADKMAWASKRETSVVEDIAYCLLGIFEVNMPLLYGEGDRAFVRLQKEIIRDTYDHSIFYWGLGGVSFLDDSRTWHDDSFDNFLAQHPRYFKSLGELCPTEEMECSTPRFGFTHSSPPTPASILFGRKRHYTLTNLGLHIELPLIFLSSKNSVSIPPCYTGVQFALGCFDGPTEDCCIALPLYFEPQSGDDLRVHRCPGSAPFIITIETAALANPERRTIYLAEGNFQSSVDLWMCDIFWNTSIEAPCLSWIPSSHFPPVVELIYHERDDFTAVRSFDDGTSSALICYTHREFGSVLVLLTSFDEPHPCSDAAENENWRASIHKQEDSGEGAWGALTSVGKYKDVDLELLNTLAWGSSCEFTSPCGDAIYRLSIECDIEDPYQRRFELKWDDISDQAIHTLSDP